jgi:ribosome biogenesis GTPase / thiamine phosphate phosphatase
VYGRSCALAGHPDAERAPIAGRLFRGDDPLALPTVGDWVMVEDGARIAAVLPRATQLVRRAAGTTYEGQVIAANVDVVFVVTSLNAEFNPRRIERYLALVGDSGASPILVLSKLDACADPAALVAVAHDLAPGVPVVLTSVVEGVGLQALAAELPVGRTGALIGSSGVGKSSLINTLLGDARQRVFAIRADDDKGRHTTARRELFELAGGGLLIDTPGMRELGSQAAGDGAADGVADVFAEIEALAAGCRFRSCAHDREPGCAVIGVVDPERVAGWRKLVRERAHAERKHAERYTRARPGRPARRRHGKGSRL